MITFKEFLAEAAIKTWKTTDLEIKKAIGLLNKHCKNGLTAIANDALIYRGFSADKFKDFTVIDTSKAKRTSRDSNNLYQIMMDASPALKGFPSRSNSLICSSSYSTAEGYGKGNDPYVIIPFDGVPIAVSSAQDFINQRIIGYEKIFSDIDSLGSLSEMVSAFNIKRENGQYLDIGKIDKAMSKFSAEQLLLEYDKKYEEALELNQYYEDHIAELVNTKLADITPEQYEKLRNFISDSNNLTPIGKTLIKIFKDHPSAPFTGLAGAMLTPKNLMLGLATFGDPIRKDVECWFSGKAVIISRHMFHKILKELVADGYDVNPNIISRLK